MEIMKVPEDAISNDDSIKSRRGISIITVCLFIVGEIAGTGILAFPESFKGMGWFGTVVIILACLGGGYTGIALGNSWLILEDRDECHKERTRDPYSVIGEVACGVAGRRWTSITLVIMLFGSSCIQELVFSETMSALIPDNGLPFCYWIVVIGIGLLPFTYLGSPVDFWPVAFFAMSSTTIACFLIVIAILIQDDQFNVETTETFLSDNTSVIIEQLSENFGFDDVKPIFHITFKSIMLGISTVVFGFGGAGVLPTIQNDMRDKRQFNKAIVIAFALMLCLYLPVSSIGYWKFGTSVKSNIIRNLRPSPLVTAIQVLVLAHVFSAFLIQINPVNLTLETALGIEDSFNWKRCASRTFIVFLSVMTGLTVPKFGKLLNFLGAFSVSLQSFVLPALFYLKLRHPHKGSSSSWYSFLTPLSLGNFSLLLIAGFGIFIACFSTVYSLIDLIHPDSFAQPCFVNACVKLD